MLFTKNDKKSINLAESLLFRLSDGMTVQEAADLAGRTFEKRPAVLIRTSGTLIAFSVQTDFQDKNIQSQLENGGMNEMTYAVCKDDKLLFRLNSSTHAFCEKDPHNKNLTWLFAPVKIKGVVAAYFAVIGDEKGFSDKELSAADTFCKAFSVLLQKDEDFSRYAQNSNSVFLHEILNEKELDERKIKIRSKMLRFPVYDEMCVMVIKSRTEKNLSSSPLVRESIIQTLVQDYLKNTVSTSYKNQIVVLSKHEKNMDFSTTLLEASEILRKNGLLLGISGIFTNITKIKTYYTQALDAIEIGLEHNAKSLIFSYSDYALFHLLKTSAVDPKELCVSQLYKMNYSSSELERDEVKTLFVYLRNMKNVAKSSEELHIHRNTLFYRIKKVTEAASLDLNSGDDVLKILLTDKIIQFLEH